MKQQKINLKRFFLCFDLIVFSHLKYIQTQSTDTDPELNKVVAGSGSHSKPFRIHNSLQKSQYLVVVVTLTTVDYKCVHFIIIDLDRIFFIKQFSKIMKHI